ncbi:N-acetylmuramoyl-L-alanine amidase [bacterium]|nr:N-acetylmuramoyl-L-alanine amidase [bacterium]
MLIAFHCQALVIFKDFTVEPYTEHRLAGFMMGELEYVNAEDLAAALNINIYRAPEKGKLVYYLPAGQLKLSADNHFVVFDKNRVFNLPAPLREYEGVVYVPIKIFIENLQEYFTGRMTYSPGQIIYSGGNYNILGIAANYFPERLELDILTSEELEYSCEVMNGDWICLYFPGGVVNKSGFAPAKLPAGIDSASIDAGDYELMISLKLKSGAKVEDVYRSVSPLGVKICVSGINPAVDYSSVLAGERAKWKFDIICIDPGHGGKDPGAIGPTGLNEKDVVLDVALRLCRLLEKKARIKVILTRDKDDFIPLYHRSEIANKADAKLFVSIHCNAARDRRAQGFQSFFLKPARNEKAMEVALLENSVIKFENAHETYRQLTDENYILLAMTQSLYVHESEQLCAFIQDRFDVRTSMKSRGVDQAGFYVLYGVNMPAVLFEIAFISNKHEEKLLKGKKFRQTIAETLCESIEKFLRESDK